MEPVLPTLVLRPVAIPGDAQRLIASAGKAIRYCWSGVTPRCRRLRSRGAARPAVRAHEELAVAPKERRRDVPVGEGHVIEVPAHGLLVRDLHGQVVMQAVPASVLLRMACAADSAADKGGIASTGRVHRGGGAGCEATSLRRSGRIRRPTPSSTSTPATTPPSSISRLERRQGRGEAPPSPYGACGLSVSSDSSPSPTWVISAAYMTVPLNAAERAVCQ